MVTAYFLNFLLKNPATPIRLEPSSSIVAGSEAVGYQTSVNSMGIALAIPAAPRTNVTAHENSQSIFIMIVPCVSMQIRTATIVNQASQL